jgi:hypothetical protein
MGGQEANQRLVELTVHETHGEFYEDAGEFLPLSVWAVKGYDPQVIEQGALDKDKRFHPVLGQTFRVNIIRGGHRGSRIVGKSDKLSAAGPMPALSALTGPTPQLALADVESSDSSSSSSSSRHKRSKKSKKSKKAKKAKKQNRKRARSEEKVSLSSNCFCGYIIIKRPCR